MNYALRKLSDTVERTLGAIPQRMHALDKLSRYIRGAEKPKRETLDRISLLVGFQSWDKFREALHGDTDGQENFE